MLQHAQSTCLQVFRTHLVPHIACCNLLKTHACRHFGHIEHIISHAATCSKHLPAGLSDTSCTFLPHAASCSKHLPGGVSDTSCTSCRMLQQTQNTCLQVYWKVGMCRRSKTNLKTDGKLTPLKSVTHFLQQLHAFDHRRKKTSACGYFDHMSLTPNFFSRSGVNSKTSACRCVLTKSPQ